MDSLEPNWRVRVTPTGESRWDCILMTKEPELDTWENAEWWGKHLGLHHEDLYDNAFTRKGAEKKARKIIARLHRAWVHQQDESFVVTAKEE